MLNVNNYTKKKIFYYKMNYINKIDLTIKWVLKKSKNEIQSITSFPFSPLIHVPAPAPKPDFNPFPKLIPELVPVPDPNNISLLGANDKDKVINSWGVNFIPISVVRKRINNKRKWFKKNKSVRMKIKKKLEKVKNMRKKR